MAPALILAHQSLQAYARSNPGKINYASVGNGSVTHLALEFFKLQTHIVVKEAKIPRID